RLPGELFARGVGQRNVRWQLELARAGLAPRQCADHPFASAILRLLRRELQNPLPHPNRSPDEPLRSGRGNRAEADRELETRVRRTPARIRRPGALSNRSPLAKPAALLRVL